MAERGIPANKRPNIDAHGGYVNLKLEYPHLIVLPLLTYCFQFYQKDLHFLPHPIE